MTRCSATTKLASNPNTGGWIFPPFTLPGKMSTLKIIVRKRQKKVLLYRGAKLVYEAFAAHGGPGTSNGKRKILKWHYGAVSALYEPSTWFSFGATFENRVYGWPQPGKEGFVKVWGKEYRARRRNRNEGDIWYGGRWYPIWKDMNPFGVAMADLEPGSIELHGTGKDKGGRDVFPPVTHGCVRTYNKDILQIKRLVSVGTEVEITD